MKALTTVVSIALALTAAVAFAGDSGPKGPKSSKLERMTRELSLSAEQQVKVQAILEAEHQRKEAMKAETDGKLRAVLNKDQYAKLQKK